VTSELSQAEAAAIASRHVTDFNDAVQAREFGGFLTLFTDGAVIRFENVPGAGTLEFAGRDAYTTAYLQQPPDDLIDIAGPVSVQDNAVTVPFRWRRDKARGTMRLTYRPGDPEDLDDWLVSAMTVVFTPPPSN
jgi:hypothetical protein